MNKHIGFLILLLTIFVSLTAKPFNLVRSSSEGLEISFELPAYQIEQQENGYDLITVRGCEWTVEEGNPQLPIFSSVIAIPATGTAQVNYQILKESSIRGYNILPFRADPSTQRRESNMYSVNKPYPETLLLQSNPQILRGQRLISVSFCPFVYNPVTREIRVIEEVEFSVAFNRQVEGVNEVTSSRNRMNSIFGQLLDKVAVNPQDVQQRDVDDPPVLVYIAGESVISELQPLVQWKREVGYEVVVASTNETGTINSDVKSWLQNAYDNWENPVDFVCLVGDADDIGAFGQGDHEYALLEGNDQIEDIFIGRFSYANVAELQVIVNKQLLYEKTPFIGTPWLNSALLVGDTDPSGVSTIATNKYIKDITSDYNPSYQYTELYSDSPSDNNMDQAINMGVGFFNYRGYAGMSGWTNSNAENLLNGPKLPIFVIITCDTGTFVSGTSRSEAIIRVGTIQSPKGGVAAIGAATIGTHTAFNNCVDGGIFEGLYVEGFRTLGEGLWRGRANLVYNYSVSNPDNVEFFSEIIALMGDPSLQVWKKQPENMQLSAPTTIPVLTNEISIELHDLSNAPIEDAWVTVTAGDYQYSTHTNSNGIAYLQIADVTTGPITVTATHPDYIPEQHSVNYGAGSNGLSLDSVVINEGDTSLLYGNSSNVEFNLTNIGNANLTNAVVNVEGENLVNTTGGLPLNGIWSVGNQISPVFALDVANISFPEETTEVVCSVNSDQGSWSFSRMINVDSPLPVINSMTVPSSGLDYLFHGVTEDINISMTNQGAVDLQNSDVIVSCEDGRIVINTGTQSINSIASGSTSIVTINVTVGMNIVAGSNISMLMEISTASGYNTQIPFTVTVGHATAEDPLGPDSYGYYIYDEEDFLYNISPVYEWQEINALGSALPLSDNGQNQDCVTTVNLPFNFTFYGESFDVISVCSNGWISMGVSEQVTFRNWRIPGPNGPQSMIAAFWDDLRGGTIYSYHNSEDDTFIIEWDGCTNEYDRSEETFQIILYNPATYHTQTGDGAIKLQYKEFNNVNNHGGSAHGNYCSIGIMDHTGLVGLEYTYNNIYPTQALPLYDQTALFISTEHPVLQDPPIVGVSVTELSYQASVGQIITDQFSISNTGEADLRYTINKTYLTRNPEDYYSWASSENTGGPIYNWVDISLTGFDIDFTVDDQLSVPLALGFDFPYWDEVYNSIRVCSNGFLTFTSGNTSFENIEIPSDSEPNNIIAPLWDDFSPQLLGNVYYYPDSSNDRFIITYENIPFFGTTSTATFQVILYETGRIDFQYQSVQNGSTGATVGIENIDGTEGIQIVNNEAFVHDNMTISFIPSFNWIECDPISGSVSQGMSESIGLTIDTSGIIFGNYHCNIEVYSNDPTQPVVIIPVALEIENNLPPLPPEVQLPIADITFEEDTFYGSINLRRHFYDPNLDELIFSFSGNEHINMILADGEVGLMPQANWFGTEEIVFYADDGTDVLKNRSVASDTVLVTVTPVNDTPIPMNVIPEENELHVAHHDDIYFTFECYDPDSNLEYTWKVNNAIQLVGIGETQLSYTTGSNDLYIVQCLASDELNFVFKDWIVYTDGTGTHEIVEVANNELFQNIPNPFNPTTDIKFALKNNGHVKICIYDVKGRRIKTLCDGMLTHGIHTYTWNGTDDNNKRLASGVYFYRIQSKDFTKTKKAIMLK